VGSVASPTPITPISEDSISSIWRSGVRDKAAAAIQPALPPPTMTILRTDPRIQPPRTPRLQAETPAAWHCHAAGAPSRLIGDAELRRIAATGDEPCAVHQADMLLHQLLILRVRQILGFDSDRQMVVEFPENRPVELTIAGGPDRQAPDDILLAITRTAGIQIERVRTLRRIDVDRLQIFAAPIVSETRRERPLVIE